MTAHQGGGEGAPGGGADRFEWRSDNFVPKNSAESALKARQLQPGLTSAQGGAHPPQL